MEESKKGVFENFAESLNKVLTPVGRKLQSIKAIAAIGETMQSTLPLIIIGSFAVMFLCIDLGGYQAWLSTKPGLISLLGKVNSLTLGAYALWVVAVLAYIYGNKLNLKESLAALPIAVAVFFILSPLSSDGNIQSSTLGSSNLISSMLVGLVVPKLLKMMIDKKITIRMPAGVPPFVEDSFSILVPGIIVIVIAAVFDLFLSKTSFGSFTAMIYTILQIPLQKLTLSYGGFAFIMCLSSAILWPGLHANTIMGVITPLCYAAGAENMAAIAANGVPEHIIEAQFMMACDPGGQAALLIPCLIGLLFCKSKQIKKVCGVGFVPALFGIGEPILFGLPCMFNPIMLIPMILGTFWNVTCWYVGISSGLVARFTGIVLPWTTPPILNTVLASTGPISTLICHIIMLLGCAIIWMPFMKLYDKQLLEKESVDN